MRRTFADTSFYIAIANPADALHEVALAQVDECAEGIVTTEHVLTELGNYFSAKNRQLFIEMVELIDADDRTRVVPASTKLLRDGVRLYAERDDKQWSLTDCISFVVMRDLCLERSLTADRHFAQAGYSTLLAPS